MTASPASIWRLPQAIDRLPFLAAGVGLFALKYAIDCTVARAAFHRGWSPWDYLVTSVPLSALTKLTRDVGFHLTLLGVAVPFIIVGIVLTLARLRAAGLPPWLAVLFFLPVVNLLFFLLLALAPTLPHARYANEPSRHRGDVTAEGELQELKTAPVLPYGRDAASSAGLRRWLPESRRASMWVAALLPVPFGLLMTYVAVSGFRDYGAGVFVALPFTQGVIAAALHGARHRRTMVESQKVAVLCGVLTTFATFALAIEGLGCLVMLLPLAIPVMLVGGAVGYTLQAGARRDSVNPAGGSLLSFAQLMLAVPAFMAAEHAAKPAAPVYAVTTAIEVDAPPEDVWRHVIAFGRIAPPGNDDWLFRMGVAYPVEATIEGRGPGAIRHCVFSTGPFVEPITVWNEPRLLKFDVTVNPPAMREWSPYHIHPPHIDDFLVSHGGQFHLIPLDGGRRTRLEGTTWYEHNLWPAAYWRLWSDAIILRIHQRVLRHIKGLAEHAPAQPAI